MLPSMATPMLRGVTSNNNNPSVFSLPAWLVKTAACTAAPYATHSSGLIDLFNWRQRSTENLVVDSLKTSTRNRRCEIMTLIQRIDLDFRLRNTRERPFR